MARFVGPIQANTLGVLEVATEGAELREARHDCVNLVAGSADVTCRSVRKCTTATDSNFWLPVPEKGVRGSFGLFLALDRHSNTVCTYRGGIAGGLKPERDQLNLCYSLLHRSARCFPSGTGARGGFQR